MKASSGNPNLRPTRETQAPENAPSAPVARPKPPRDYCKPELKRLGLLRSVTGSNLKW